MFTLFNPATDIPMFGRFLIAVLALAVSYVSYMGLVFKNEGGLYEEHNVPTSVTPAMKRARRYYLKAMFFVGLVSVALAYMMSFVMDHATWLDVVRPALVGVSFGMLYSGLTRYDRIRPRDDR